MCTACKSSQAGERALTGRMGLRQAVHAAAAPTFMLSSGIPRTVWFIWAIILPIMSLRPEKMSRCLNASAAALR